MEQSSRVEGGRRIHDPSTRLAGERTLKGKSDAVRCWTFLRKPEAACYGQASISGDAFLISDLVPNAPIKLLVLLLHVQSVFSCLLRWQDTSESKSWICKMPPTMGRTTQLFGLQPAPGDSGRRAEVSD